MADYDIVVKEIEAVSAAVASKEVPGVADVGGAHGRLWARRPLRMLTVSSGRVRRSP